ncbi:kinase-like protein [Ceratobasidium sp. AG-I]|nr:kinase-like protein [Ceratobasidium sp. AG-I]
MAQISLKSFHNISISSSSPEELSEAEKRWVSFQPYLLSKGYQLRPRYRQGWVPSWKTTGAHPFDCEDSADSLVFRVLDATREQDNSQVVIKMLAPSNDDREGDEELEILQHLSTSICQSDPANHTVPCLDSFPMPGVEGGMFYVMPLLSEYKDPPFYDLGEICDFLLQMFEGLEFLHNNNIVHCDIASPNIMMDARPLYDEPFHPFNQHLTLDGKRPIHPKYLRSQRTIRYYYIDFGYAKWFRGANESRMITGSRAREPTPEQSLGDPYDPFKADVYQLGAVIRRDLITQYPPLRFLLPLAREMTSIDPKQRPSLEQARHSITTQFVGLSGWRKRWPIVPLDASLKHRCIYVLAGMMTEVVIFLRRVMRLVLLRKW